MSLFSLNWGSYRGKGFCYSRRLSLLAQCMLYSSRKCEFGPRIERKVKERGEWCFVSSSRSRVGIHENREVSYGFRTGRSEKSWNDSPATGGAIQLLSTIDSLSGFSNRWEQGEEFGTKRIGNGAALQMNSRCMCSCSRKHSQSLPGAGHGS